ncbi:Cell division protein FtsX [Candidatus Desulfarcum epimagneticum]|uniref:Cell division protein FtsX n=1 Tax=uncultured Desulfobacteraceae bacterium TaxID=218296 RepID=A0A484HDT0_9BACT|nr:Cell division protein FtsX [uncultured Desulfobacteraceae bacterium]
MTFSIKPALRDINQNRFLNVVTIITIALSALIVSSFSLFFLNLTEIAAEWRRGSRMMAYLGKDAPDPNPDALEKRIRTMRGVRRLSFISSEEALSRLRERMSRQSSLFDALGKNPLPDAFEIHIDPDIREWEDVESLARRVESIQGVEEVEYGQKWAGNFSAVFNVLRLAGYSLGGIFFMASLLIVSNTTRLILYSRREEIEIIRLVGGADRFIKAPLYMESLIQGAAGGLIGLAAVFVIYTLISSSSMIQGMGFSLFELRFFSPYFLILILFLSMFVGWLGCYISIKQHLKY